MDFDEYEYLEKMVEDPELEKVKEVENGSGERKKDESRSSKRRSDAKEGDKKSGEKSRDRDRHGSSRHRSSSREGERDRHRSGREQKDRDKEKDRVERNGTGRERNRDKDRDEERDRKDRGRDSERGRGKEKEKESDRSSERGRGREREKEMEHSRRSRSRSDRPRSSREEIDKEKIREKERERDQDRVFKDRERGSRRHKEKKENGEEPEADPERDQRTVFAYQINLKADERHAYEFFSRAGKVRDVRLIMDRITRRSKGVGYIEFYDAMSVPMAIALSGQPLLGTPVMVKPSEAEKNLVQSTAAAAAAGAGGAGGSVSSVGARKLYVGNLHSNLTQDQLKKIFEPFGEVELVQLPLYDTGNCKGFGFVQFARLEDARVALTLNGLEIAGRTIKVSAVTDQPGAQDAPPTSGDLDDDEGGGLSLNASTRAILMQRLDRTGTALSIAGVNSTTVPPTGAIPAMPGLPLPAIQLPPAMVVPTIDTVGVPTECLLLKNMFDPTSETEPDFDLDIKDDVQEECSKYGKLKHIFVDKNTAGFVYLRFENTESAVAAQRSLHGRWFAGKMITATFMVPQDYESKFPESQQL